MTKRRFRTAAETLAYMGHNNVVEVPIRHDGERVYAVIDGDWTRINARNIRRITTYGSKIEYLPTRKRTLLLVRGKR